MKMNTENRPVQIANAFVRVAIEDDGHLSISAIPKGMDGEKESLDAIEAIHKVLEKGRMPHQAHTRNFGMFREEKIDDIVIRL